MENIRYGRSDATDAEVVEAAVSAKCRDFIEALPHGFANQMFTADQHRSRAAKYRGFLDISRSPGEISEFRNLEQSHATLADDEDWLARNVEKSSQSRNMTSQHQDTITMTLRPQRERRVCSPVPRSGCHGAVEYLA
jgi:hypothetical protein